MKDYKEMYEQAIERLKQWDREHPNGYSVQDRDEFIFPELKESEDERIRKEIIELVMQPSWKSEQEFHRRKELVAWLEKQGEQKPIEWSENDNEMIYNIRKIIEKYAFSQSAVDVNGDLCEREYIEADDWMKSLKDRVLPKQEWSKEDEEMLNLCLDAATSSEHYTQADFDKMELWLKSLNPQNRWKPSDEQMKALDKAIYDVDDSIATQLAMLIGDLRKLKGE